MTDARGKPNTPIGGAKNNDLIMAAAAIQDAEIGTDCVKQHNSASY